MAIPATIKDEYNSNRVPFASYVGPANLETSEGHPPVSMALQLH